MSYEINCSNRYAFEIEDYNLKEPFVFTKYFKTKTEMNKWLKNKDYNLGNGRKILRKYKITYKRLT